MSMVIIYILGAVFTQRNDDFGGFCLFSGKRDAHLRGLEVGFAKKYREEILQNMLQSENK